MANFWDFEIWSWVLIWGVLLGSLLVGNIIKKGIPLLKKSLIPTLPLFATSHRSSRRAKRSESPSVQLILRQQHKNDGNEKVGHKE